MQEPCENMVLEECGKGQAEALVPHLLQIYLKKEVFVPTHLPWGALQKAAESVSDRLWSPRLKGIVQFKNKGLQSPNVQLKTLLPT